MGVGLAVGDGDLLAGAQAEDPAAAAEPLPHVRRVALRPALCCGRIDLDRDDDVPDPAEGPQREVEIGGVVDARGHGLRALHAQLAVHQARLAGGTGVTHDQRLRPAGDAPHEDVAEQDRMTRVPRLEEHRADDDGRLATAPRPQQHRHPALRVVNLQHRPPATRRRALQPTEDLRVGEPRRPAPRARSGSGSSAIGSGQLSRISSALFSFSATTTRSIGSANSTTSTPTSSTRKGSAPGSRWCSTHRPVCGSRADSASRTSLLFHAAFRPMTMQSNCRSACNSASNVRSV